MISVFFLIAAILVFCLKTHPGLRVAEIDDIVTNNTLRQIRSPGFVYKYRTEAIGVDKKNSKPHSGFFVSSYLFFDFLNIDSHFIFLMHKLINKIELSWK